MRMQIRRFTRLTNGFSKKFENHWAALALYFAYYNFCRIHSTIRVTPAMEAGITDHVTEESSGGRSQARGLAHEALVLRIGAAKRILGSATGLCHFSSLDDFTVKIRRP